MPDTAPSGYSARPGRMVLPIRPREEATVTAMPHTPDGACEVILEVNGHLLGTWVVTPDCTRDEVALVLAQIAETIQRKC